MSRRMAMQAALAGASTPAMATPRAGAGICVIHADDIRGPWSTPIDLNVPGCIDPGHVVGEDGRRYLFVNGGRRVRLKDDALSIRGKGKSLADCSPLVCIAGAGEVRARHFVYKGLPT